MSSPEKRAAHWEKMQQQSGHWILRQKGVSPVQQDNQRKKAAAHVQEALWLLAQGVKLNINKVSQDMPKITVLHLAAHLGMKAEIKQLLYYGANMRKATKDGMEPWMEAAVMRHKAALELLVPIQVKIGLWDKFKNWIYPPKDRSLKLEYSAAVKPRKTASLISHKTNHAHLAKPHLKGSDSKPHSKPVR